MDCNHNQSFTLRCVTYNVRGLRDNTKRGGIFAWLKAQNADVIFLQETHCGDEDDSKKWGKEWGHTSFWSPGTNRSCGTAILLSNKIDKNNVELIFEAAGRVQILELKNTPFKKKLRFVNDYAPNNGEDRKKFFCGSE